MFDVRKCGRSVVGEIEKDSRSHSAGFTCLIDNAGRLLSPKSVSDEQFESKLTMIRGVEDQIDGNKRIPCREI